MAPTISKVKPSLWEASSGSAGSVAGATLAKKRQKIGETELYKVSNNRSLPICSQASQAAAQAGKEGAGDRAAGSPAPAAVLSQYDTSDDDTGNKGAINNGINNEVANDDSLNDGLTNDESGKGGAGARIDGAAYAGPKDEGANGNGINDEASDNDGLYNGLNNGLANDESGERSAGARTDGTAYARPKEDVEAAQANAIVGRAEVDKATGGKVDEDGHAGNGGNGLRYSMAGLEATMVVPGSTASCFAERAQASQATAEEVATEHAAVCRLIVDDQAGALGQALGPEATERTYLAVLNAEGVFLMMHGLQWWAEAPGRARNHRGQMVAFEGEVRMGMGVPNLWRFEEPDDQLFWLLTLPPVLLSDTALYYEDEKHDKYYCATVAPDAGGPGWAPVCGHLIPIPVEWAPMFLDYPDSGTAFCRLVNLVNLVDGAKRDKYTYLAQSIAYACLFATKEEHPVSTMAAWWKRVVMSRAIKTWAMSAWMGKPPLDEAKEECPTVNATTPPIDDFSSIFGGQAKRMAVTVPNG